jgi:FAD/FMN-containing dehydrogenase
VNCAHNEGVPVAVRGGGDNGAGLGVCDGGIVIDLLSMKGVLVDRITSTIRAEAGCTQADLNHAAHDFGLAVPLGIGYCCETTTPIAG